MREGNEQRKKRKIKIMGKRTRKQQNEAKNVAIEVKKKKKTGRQKVVKENARGCRKARRS